MQLHPAPDLIHRGPVRASVQMPQRWLEVHMVLLLGPVEEQGPDYDAPHHNEGPAGALPARRRSARHKLACPTPACLISEMLSVQAILVAGARGGGMRGMASGQRIPRDGGGGGGWAPGRGGGPKSPKRWPPPPPAEQGGVPGAEKGLRMTRWER